MDIHAGLLQHFHGMRGLRGDLWTLSPKLIQPTDQPLRHIFWLNFFHPKDIIAGHLDAFSGVTNIRSFGANQSDPAFPESHLFYWYDRRMYECIHDWFMSQDVRLLMDENDQSVKRRDELLGELWTKYNRGSVRS